MKEIDRRDFIHFMKENKKSVRTIARYVTYMETFEKYLLEKKRGKHFEETTPGDVKDFAFWGVKNLKVSPSIFGRSKFMLNISQDMNWR